MLPFCQVPTLPVLPHTTPCSQLFQLVNGVHHDMNVWESSQLVRHCTALRNTHMGSTAPCGSRRRTLIFYLAGLLIPLIYMYELPGSHAMYAWNWHEHTLPASRVMVLNEIVSSELIYSFTRSNKRFGQLDVSFNWTSYFVCCSHTFSALLFVYFVIWVICICKIALDPLSINLESYLIAIVLKLQIRKLVGLNCDLLLIFFNYPLREFSWDVIDE